jgi:hypothetical protein
VTATRKLSDVWWMTVSLLPMTTCEPPTGTHCFLQQSTTALSPADAKRHALQNPGHLVYRDIVSRTQYHVDPEDTDVRA